MNQFPTVSEISALRETRIASDLFEMTETELARETIDVLKAKYLLTSTEVQALKDELSDWAHDELIALWDGCQVTFITACPTMTDRWLERCTVNIGDVVTAVSEDTRKILLKGEQLRWAVKYIAKHPHSVQQSLCDVKERFKAFQAEHKVYSKQDWKIHHQLTRQISRLTEIETERLRALEALEHGMD